MKYITTLILITTCLSVYGQKFYDAQIEYVDNEVVEGVANIPKNDSRKVAFKFYDSSKVHWIKSDEIKTITYKPNNGKFYTIIRIKTKSTWGKKDKKFNTKISKKKKWLYVANSHPELNLYLGSYEYRIDKKGEFELYSSGRSGFTGIAYYLKRPEEKVATYITGDGSGIAVGKQKMFKNSARKYFKNNTELVNRIDNNEFKSNRFFEFYETIIDQF